MLVTIKVLHLSAAIPGGLGDHPGKHPVISTTMFTNPPYPKPTLFNKKLLTPLPWGQRSVLCQVKRQGRSYLYVWYTCAYLKKSKVQK